MSRVTKAFTLTKAHPHTSLAFFYCLGARTANARHIKMTVPAPLKNAIFWVQFMPKPA